jgi:hypothetical protein
MLRFPTLAMSLIIGGMAVAAAATELTANEYCYGWATELVRQAEHCVSSVRRPQLGINYGPNNLVNERGGWCSGAPGDGIGEWILVRFDPGMVFQSIYARNGYAQSPVAFAESSRVKQLQIETSNGFTTTAMLEDHSRQQVIRLQSQQQADWIKFTISEVYPGGRYEGVCLGMLGVDIEEYQRDPVK